VGTRLVSAGGDHSLRPEKWSKLGGGAVCGVSVQNVNITVQDRKWLQTVVTAQHRLFGTAETGSTKQCSLPYSD